MTWLSCDRAIPVVIMSLMCSMTCDSVLCYVYMRLCLSAMEVTCRPLNEKITVRTASDIHPSFGHHAKTDVAVVDLSNRILLTGGRHTFL